MNKKGGFLLGEETIKIIITVLCFLVLIGILYALYGNFTQDQNVEFAKRTLNYIEKEMNAKSKKIEILNPGPDFWAKPFAGYWGLVSLSGDVPNFCKEKSWTKCLCFCPPPGASVHSYPMACLTAKPLFGPPPVVCIQSDFKIKGDVIVMNKIPIVLNISYETKEITRLNK